MLPDEFHRPDAAGARAALAESFVAHYGQSGCAFAEPVALTSGIDPSVVFVGSSISALKEHITGRAVPVNGVGLAQPSLRTHNANMLLRPGFGFEWGGLFTNVSLLACAGGEAELAAHTTAFFLDALGFAPHDVRLRVSSADPDLLALCRDQGRGIELEVDTRQPAYYRHRIGLDGVVGRNFNVALRCAKLGGHRDVGNFIVYHDTTSDYSFLEVGFGDTTILRARYDLAHVLDCFPFPALDGLSTSDQRLFEDTASVSVALWREGLRPSSRNAQTKLQAKYLRALFHCVHRNGMPLREAERVIESYEIAEHGGSTGAAEQIIAYLAVNATRIQQAVAAGTTTGS